MRDAPFLHFASRASLQEPRLDPSSSVPARHRGPRSRSRQDAHRLRGPNRRQRGRARHRRCSIPSLRHWCRHAGYYGRVATVVRATPDAAKFNEVAVLPYQLRQADVGLGMQDVYDLLFDVNTALVGRGLRRLEDTVRPAVFSGIMSDALTASIARHARVLTENRFHNGHPDLIPEGRYAKDAVKAGGEGIEIKATRGRGAVDAHGARDAWVMVFRYEVDTATEPAIARAPTRIVEVLLAELTIADFRRNERGELGTRTASPNREGVAKLRAGWVYRE